MNENLELRFGASAASADAVISELISHVRQLNATMGELGSHTGQTNQILGTMVQHLQGAKGHAKDLAEHGHEVNNSFFGALEQMEGIHRKVGQIAELFAAAFAVEMIVSATERVLEWGEAHAAAAEHLEQEAQRLGMTVTEIERWNTVATMTGRTGDEFVQAFTRLERAFERSTTATSEQAGALRQLGLNAQSARSPNELLLQVADRFHDMADGPQKVAIAMALMGRSGAQNIPILNLGREALQHLMEEGERYGAVMDESMVAENARIAETLNTSKIAMQGLGNTLFSILAPSLETSARAFNRLALWMIESYRSGGTVATMVTVLGYGFRILETIVVVTGTMIWGSFQLMYSGVQLFVGLWVATYDIFKTTIQLLKEAFVDLGRTIFYALTYQWGSIVSTVQDAANRIHNIVANSMNDAAPWFQGAGQSMSNARRTMGAGEGFLFGQGGVWNPGNPPTAPAPPHRPTSMDISRLGSGGGQHGGVSEVQRWEQQLHQMEITSGEYFRDQTARELQFWQDHLAMTTAGSRSWYEVQDKIFTLSRRAAQENYQEQVAALDFEIQARQGHYEQMAEIEARKVELVRSTYGEESRQYRDVLREQLRMKQQHDQEILREMTSAAQQRAEIERQAAATDLDIEIAGLGMQRSMVEYGLQAGTMGRVTAARVREEIDRREYAARVEAENRDFQLTLATLHDQMELENLSDQERAALYEQRERALADHEQRMRHLSLDNAVKMQGDALATANAYRDTWMSRLQPINDALTSMVNGFLTSTTSLRSAILQMGSSILQAVNSWVMRWVTMHIAGEHAKTAATVAGNAARTASEVGANATGMAMTAASATAEITTHGAVAAAGALRAISHIPVIGPFIAPAIAAGILALAMSFISRVASAEGGWGRVPTDGMLTELHKDEMVLPSSIATPLRNALSGPDWSMGATGLAASAGFGAGAPAAALAGTAAPARPLEVHIHAMDGKSVKRVLMDNRQALADVLRSAARDNV